MYPLYYGSAKYIITRAGYFPGNFKIPGTGILKIFPGFPGNSREMLKMAMFTI